MRDIFKGWRRKIGVMTLMMALVCSTVWMRSQGNAYVVLIRECQIATCVISGCGEFAMVSSDAHSFRYGSSGGDPEFRFDRPLSKRSRRIEIITNSQKARNLAVFYEEPPGTALRFRPEYPKMTTIPYGSIALPLTLLSAWLLLSKPRFTAPKSIEPAPAGNES